MSRCLATEPIDSRVCALARTIPSAEQLCLPAGYRQNAPRARHDAPEEYWTPERISLSRVYQSHVYAWAARLTRSRREVAVLDVGCGVGTKIRPILKPRCQTVVGLDTAESVAKARRLGSAGRFIEVDLESPDLQPWRTFDVILCADVIEHLDDPTAVLELIRSFSGRETDIIVSTPDRDRLRGRACLSCDKPDHVREWSRAEFVRFLRSRGLIVQQSRLFPQDDSPAWRHIGAEMRYRLHLARQSPLVCHAVRCRTEGH